ncbi:MAG TPA: PQQ-binding-like beta-propeller repeat protein [Vicinamibacteria bacterium]|nr:PQQ-binding-like beta-propeller repeat protein [Vicinamibacteria bacterium]
MRKRALVLLFAASLACSRRLATPPVLFPVQQSWKAVADAGLLPPLVTDGERLFCARGDGSVEALALDGGGSLWRAAPGQGWLSAAQGALVLRREDGTVRRLDPATGATLWTTATAVAGRAPVLIEGEQVFVGGAGLVALAASDGRLLWRATDGADATTAPAVSGARLFVGEEDGTLRCRDRATGLTRWTLATGSALRAPVLPNGDRLLVGTSDGRFLAVSPDKGHVRWRWKLGADVADVAVAFAEDVVLFTSYENVLYALDRDNGHLRWRAPLPSRPISAPLLIGSAAVVACQELEVVAFDARTGRRLGAATVPAEIRTPPVFARDRLYLGLRDRSVLAFSLDLTPSAEVKLPPGPRPTPKPVTPARGRERDQGPLQQPQLP